jgi:hypothetical protein
VVTLRVQILSFTPTSPRLNRVPHNAHTQCATVRQQEGHRPGFLQGTAVVDRCPFGTHWKFDPFLRWMNTAQQAITVKDLKDSMREIVGDADGVILQQSGSTYQTIRGLFDVHVEVPHEKLLELLGLRGLEPKHLSAYLGWSADSNRTSIVFCSYHPIAGAMPGCSVPAKTGIAAVHALADCASMACRLSTLCAVPTAMIARSQLMSARIAVLGLPGAPQLTLRMAGEVAMMLKAMGRSVGKAPLVCYSGDTEVTVEMLFTRCFGTDISSPAACTEVVRDLAAFAGDAFRPPRRGALTLLAHAREGVAWVLCVVCALKTLALEHKLTAPAGEKLTAAQLGYRAWKEGRLGFSWAEAQATQETYLLRQLPATTPRGS